MNDLMKLTRYVWEIYLGSDHEKTVMLFDMIDDDITVVGTGKEEIYHNKKEFQLGMTRELEERSGISFKIKNYTCYEQKISDDIYIHNGETLVFWESEDHSVCVNLDTRFTIVYKRINSKWMIVHLHHSVPNIEQMDNEAYPKTMREQVEKANQEITELSDLAKKDALTGLYNKRYLTHYFQEVDKTNLWIYMIDIDDFKCLNDEYGHLIGDDALVKVANILSHIVENKGIACRIGGDEFLIMCTNIKSNDEAKQLVDDLFEHFKNQIWGDYDFTSISVGYDLVGSEDTLDGILERVDQALYQAKYEGKNRYKKY